MKIDNSKIYHTIDPVYDENSKILILGSIPSVKSREENFYYAHPKNRFWKVLADVYEEEEPLTIMDKKSFLKKKNIALYDVIKSCNIAGSSDASIKNVKVNDIKGIVDKTKISKIFTTGKTAYKLYNKYLKDIVGIEAICLPSTSPANMRISYKELLENYKMIKKSL